ncbi:MAG: hypothetical protein LBV43_00725 [Prevotella sp.]|jgi:hypothetical protein|nr:hypothetical protein [Prevotella sp.]
MYKKLILIVIVVIMVTGCNRPVTGSGVISTDSKLLSSLKADAVETLVIGSNSFVLDAYLWTDLQPSVSEKGKPISSINWLIDKDSVKIPDNINLIKQYVVYKDSIWMVDYTDEIRPDQPVYRLEKISRDGPEWGPEAYVDVIALIYDSKARKNHYIKHQHVLIEQVD